MTFPPLKSPLKFYAVVPTADWVERMVKAGADTVQLRCKILHGDELKREIERCVVACQNSATQLFINDHWREAIAAGAYGVHLGQEDMDTADLAAIAAAGLRLGLSTHSVAELDRALSVHPSYVASGAIFPTTTKQMPTAPQGLDKLREYVKQAGGNTAGDFAFQFIAVQGFAAQLHRVGTCFDHALHPIGSGNDGVEFKRGV